MALYSELILKSDHDPLRLDKHVIDSISARFTCPVAWKALFSSEQIDLKNFIILSPTIKALQTLEERSPVLGLAFGQAWAVEINEFVECLSSSKYLVLNLREWYGESSEFERHMQSEFEIFSEPFYSGGKHFFSRKPKTNSKWRDYLATYKNHPVFGEFDQ